MDCIVGDGNQELSGFTGRKCLQREDRTIGEIVPPLFGSGKGIAALHDVTGLRKAIGTRLWIKQKLPL
jgi:hypothetical protein